MNKNGEKSIKKPIKNEINLMPILKDPDLSYCLLCETYFSGRFCGCPGRDRKLSDSP